MMTPNDLRRHLDLRVLDDGSDGRMLLGALGSVAALIGDDEIEGHASWLDDSMSFDEPTGVHIRVVVARGVISLDYEFSFDGLPAASLLPWSRVRVLRVIAKPKSETIIANVWLETDEQDIEFAGAAKDQFAPIVDAVRRYLR